MAQALQMLHDRDPKDELLEAVAPYLGDIHAVLGARVMIAVYKRPDKLKSGLYVADKTRDEDEYQGKVGLVIKVGSIAFTEDEAHQFGPRTPKVGDWVMYRVGDTFGFKLGDRVCRMVEDVDVAAILERPDVAY